jgi:hypothetical protein
MTHTLHRRGDLESLSEDYVMLIMASRDVNMEGSQEKMKQIWDLLSKYEADLVNYGNITAGNSQQVEIRELRDLPSRLMHAVFKDRERLKSCLKEIKERDFGLSVVLSGIYEEVEKICAEIGLKPHTIEYSLGIHGKTDKLPGEETLDITTMCGHAMVSPNLVLHMANEIKAGRINAKDAAKELSKGCACGIFNPYRAAKLLRKIAAHV